MSTIDKPRKKNDVTQIAEFMRRTCVVRLFHKDSMLLFSAPCVASAPPLFVLWGGNLYANVLTDNETQVENYAQVSDEAPDALPLTEAMIIGVAKPVGKQPSTAWKEQQDEKLAAKLGIPRIDHPDDPTWAEMHDGVIRAVNDISESGLTSSSMLKFMNAFRIYRAKAIDAWLTWREGPQTQYVYHAEDPAWEGCGGLGIEKGDPEDDASWHLTFSGDDQGTREEAEQLLQEYARAIAKRFYRQDQASE